MNTQFAQDIASRISQIERHIAVLATLPTPVKHNLGATTLPTVTDDITSGYAKGSRWLTSSGDYRVCYDNSEGAAQWMIFTTSIGGSAADHGSLTGLSDDDHSIYLLADGSRTLSGNLTVTGTVDGVNLSI